jgi:integrase
MSSAAKRKFGRVAADKYPYLLLRSPKRPGGATRYVIFYIDANGKRQERSTGAFDGELERAKEALEAHKAEHHAPAFRDGRPDQVLITDVLSYYNARKIESGKADEVMRSDTARAALRNLGQFFANSTVADIGPDLANDYVSWRVTRGDARGSNKWKARGPNLTRTLKPSTAWNDIRFLNSALNKAWENKKLTHQIRIALPSEAISTKRLRCLDDHERARLLRGALGWDQDGVRHRSLINYPLARFIVTGLRSGTRKDRILRLQWVQNFDGGFIDLDGGILHRKADCEKDTKKSAPPMAMTRKLWAHMSRWRRLSARWVVEQNCGKPFRDLDTAFANACVLAGLSIAVNDPMKVTPHTLRHSCVTAYLEAGYSCYEVGQMVGMTAQMVEQRYAHSSLEKQREAQNRVENKRVPSHSRPTKTQKRA